MRRAVNLFIAERTVVAVIVLNTLALLVMGFTDPKLSGPGRTIEAIHAVGRWVDYGCVVFFVAEMLLKMREFGWRGYWGENWNRFDFSVVMLSLPLLLSPFFELEAFSVVLALRLGRLFRLFRVMRFIPNRENLYAGIQRALRASVGVFLALLLVNLILSLGATQLFGPHAPEYFGNPALSSYSLFRVFTVEGWYEIPDAIAARSHPAIAVMARLYFGMSVMVGGILGLSLANAVFVDEMTLDNNAEVEDKLDELVAEVRALRKRLDEAD